jgi:hypothetical protein
MWHGKKARDKIDFQDEEIGFKVDRLKAEGLSETRENFSESSPFSLQFGVAASLHSVYGLQAKYLTYPNVYNKACQVR